MNKVRRAKPLLGTVVEINARAVCDQNALNAIVDQAFERIARVDSLMSVHSVESDVTKLNQNGLRQPVKVDPWTYQVLQMAEKLNADTEGIFDITIGRELMEAGFIAHDLFSSSVEVAAPDRIILYPIKLLAECYVSFTKDVVIDLSGIAKGFAVDVAVDFLRNAGIDEGIVNAGGDIRCFGPTSHTIALRDPEHPSQYLEALMVRNQALATSSPTLSIEGNRGRTVSRLLHGVSRQMNRSSASVSILAPSCMVADGLTKVAFYDFPRLSAVLGHYGAKAFKIEKGQIYTIENMHDTGATAAQQST